MNLNNDIKYEIVVDGKSSIMLGMFLKMAIKDGLRPSSIREV